ncbi:FecCD family ABC transporter permease [Mycolicibacterium vaccae]|uniref:ABC-type Fe3+-siderophore transporter permease n=1 Tax=Mycolicibacterium vaccae ATCC 25954 TaxID=1194972 RepID=K0UKM3_MYCVA|nr:iron ABC transporter permease [Mycolicibacterium vaccae]ANI38874.1 ABC transporter permease [Mycolicibacterium vaccae 95051]EJZ05530.1 ABC-type Fe3+-siderophore transporter permease [Mycolicibacterium vaccae ATCC 25954]
MSRQAVTDEPRSSTAGGHRRLPYPLVLVGLSALLVATVIAGLAIGSIAIPPADVVRSVAAALLPSAVDADVPAHVHTVITQVRAPRVLLGAVVGAGLAVIGMTLQALVRNPLAEPFLLGVSSGASVGAVAVIVSGVGVAGWLSPSLAAFAGALAALTLVYGLSSAAGQITTTRLVLAGVAVSYVLSAVTSLMLLTADTGDRARQVLTWLLGGLGSARWDTLWLPLTVVVAGLILLLAQARTLNVLLAGDAAATTMGVDTPRFRARMFVLTSLLTGVLVAASGPIGFVGLILPHAVRLVVGSDHRRALPAAALAGASFLVLADIAARTLASPQEIPVGVLTALCGGPFFLWLLRRDARRAAAGAQQ